MGDQEHSLPAVGEPAGQLHQPALKTGIQAGRRLVEQQQLGAADQLEGHRGALSLPAREVADPPLADVFEADLVEHIGDRRLALLGSVAFGQAQPGGEGQRLLDTQQVVQRVVLRDVADVSLAQADILPADRDGAGARGSDPAYRLQQRALARPTGAYDRDQFARLEA